MHTCKDMILYCKWKKLVRKCNEIFEVRKTDDGYCCSFNALPLNQTLYVLLDIILIVMKTV